MLLKIERKCGLRKRLLSFSWVIIYISTWNTIFVWFEAFDSLKIEHRKAKPQLKTFKNNFSGNTLCIFKIILNTLSHRVWRFFLRRFGHVFCWRSKHFEVLRKDGIERRMWNFGCFSKWIISKDVKEPLLLLKNLAKQAFISRTIFKWMMKSPF